MEPVKSSMKPGREKSSLRKGQGPLIANFPQRLYVKLSDITKYTKNFL